jgi:hypothetical protein
MKTVRLPVWLQAYMSQSDEVLCFIVLAIKDGRRGRPAVKHASTDSRTVLILGGGAGGLIAAETLRAVSMSLNSTAEGRVHTLSHLLGGICGSHCHCQSRTISTY